MELFKFGATLSRMNRQSGKPLTLGVYKVAWQRDAEVTALA